MITPVLLCGGSGTRLWPLSRQSYPKQFSALVGDTSLFQASAQRLNGADFAPPVIVTNAEFRFIVTEQLLSVGIDPGAILIEPEGRNTAPAILAAALLMHKQDPDGLLLVAPSDHVVPDAPSFAKAVMAGAPAARDGRLVTFGIDPTHPETGYGYLELDNAPDFSALTPVSLRSFVEKPQAEAAQAMLASGNFLWNAGIFLFSARAILEAFEAYAPQIVTPVRAALDHAETDLGFLRLAPDHWSRAQNVSIDYAVMEHAKNLSVVPFGGAWSDLGNWATVRQEMPRDANGVALSGAATAIDCSDTLLRSEDAGQELVGIGLQNIIAVSMPDAVLIADANRAQDVKEAVTALRAKGAKQATAFPKEHRPWGWFETLVLGARFQVKRIVVNPGGALSLQSHHHRAEHWVVVEGTAQVTLDEATSLLGENQSVYIPLGAKHKLENPGKFPLVLIEVQSGSYLGEDDIIRYQDAYARK